MKSLSILILALQAISICSYRLNRAYRVQSSLRAHRAKEASSADAMTDAIASLTQRGFKAIFAAAMFSGLTAFGAADAMAADRQYKLPPIDRRDPDRCVLSSSSMGQANAARDKLYDLRECDLHGKDGSGKDLSG
jgi:hypothetical protein